MAGRPKKAEVPKEINRIECVRCGKIKHENEFYMSKYSKIFNINGKKVPVCKECLQSLMDEYTEKYDERTALIICCAVLDIPFNAELYAKSFSNANVFNLGVYARQLQMTQYSDKSFLNTITGGELSKTEAVIKDNIEGRWSKNDRQNKNYSISTVGYDPFENCGMTDEDRKYCFNLLAGYCDIDGIKEDGHKMTCCIQIVQSQLQVRKLDEMINQEFLSSECDESKIKSLTESKKKLQDSIAKIAQDNNISSNRGGNSRNGRNTLSGKMKEMTAEGFEAARVNLFDIKTAESMEQVAALSCRAIINELNFGDSELSEMVKEQRDKLSKLRVSNETLEEENRNLRNEVTIQSP